MTETEKALRRERRRGFMRSKAKPCPAYDEAVRNGKPTYHGKPCPRCGGTLRRTNNRGCVECHREASRENARKRRAAQRTSNLGENDDHD